MATTTKKIYKIYNELSSIKTELSAIKSLLIALVGKDPEGEYRQEFVEEILKSAKEKPEYKFKNAKEFLKLLKKQ